MTQTKFMDPFTIWKDMYEKTEETWSDIIQESMKKETFSQGLGQTLNNHLQNTEMISGITESYLKQLNIPTRDEIASLATLVINLEEKVDDLQDNISEELVNNQTSKDIKALKDSVSHLDLKLDQIIEAMTDKKKVPANKGK
ncbi:polyhydroxyalkanoate biosynthesis repressor PhaR [Sporosarcina sp. P13]|uniref:polyhydroxyalkanoate biosynthesis repressor PhaR n=1 Tax=Sporosarcina sp. P13 TaxID=2048263 RepID=UPI000C16E030|nr:polyhydroxyalkanoate biosynthesis repressor PhaR [Sporosarcina sp. P13]PIC63036.1 polyhydroxyalkanoate biosynthesis repressor PhaR [Sporosarcina sp. P13]